MLLKNAGNDRHFSSDVAHFSSNSTNPPDDGQHLLLQEPFLLGLGNRKTYGIRVHHMNGGNHWMEKMGV